MRAFPAKNRMGKMVLLAGVVASGTACVQHPLIVTEPTRVVVESRSTHPPPAHAVQWDTDFWRAVAALNLTTAWIIASTPEERRLVDALQLMTEGRTSSADSTIAPLLSASDTLVRNAAWLTRTALLSARAAWDTLAILQAQRTEKADASRDAAGVEAWAPSFRDIHTRITFADTIIELPLTRSATGIATVPVRINGVVRYFWIDTGSSITILSSTVAEACHVAVRGNDTLELLTAVGRIPARPAPVRTLQVGGATIADVPAMIVDTAMLALRATANGDRAERFRDGRATPVDGVIGFDIIRALDLTIDDARHRVIVRRPIVQHDPTRSRNAFWFGVPIVTLMTPRGVAVHLSLDTGAEETYGTRSLSAKTRVRAVIAERRSVHGFGGSSVERGLVLPRVRLFLRDVPLSLERVFLFRAQYPTLFELDGTLGADVGRGGVLRIDMTNGRVEVGM